MPANSAVEQDVFQEFSSFVDQVLGGLGDRSLEEALLEFRAFQSDRERVLARLALARLESQRGLSRELDDEAFWRRVDERLDRRGAST